MQHSKTYLAVRFITRTAVIALPFVIIYTIANIVYAWLGLS